jgi:hypothetical protein
LELCASAIYNPTQPSLVHFDISVCYSLSMFTLY